MVKTWSSKSTFFTCLLVLLLSLQLQAGKTEVTLTQKEIQGINLFAEEQVYVSLTTMPANQKGVVLVFLSAVCPCSDSHISEMKKLAETYKNFQFVAVHSNVNETRDLAVTYFKKASLPFPVINDPTAQIADIYKAYKTPHAYLFNRDGKIVYQGGVTSSALADQAEDHYLKEALAAVNDGQTVKIPFGRTLGCVISRSKDD